MNIDQYRALKAEEAKPDSETKAPEQPAVTPVVTETKPPTPETPTPETKPTPEKLIVDGEEFSLDDVKEWKNGYLRTQDYTKKTQEVANQRKEAAEALELYNYLRSNPQVAQALLANGGNPQNVQAALANTTPENAKVAKLEQQLFDMMLQRDIDELQRKYPDFEVREVLTLASEKNLTNLEDAYKIAKASKPVDAKATPVDVEAMKKELRTQLLKELEDERASTTTIISSNTGALPDTTDKEPTWSTEEDKVRVNMKMSVKEWAKWRNQ